MIQEKEKLHERKLIVFDEEMYNRMMRDISLLVKEEVKKISRTKEWLSAEEAKILLGVRSKTKMQQLRDNGEIVFSQHGRIIKYKRQSLIDFLERNAKHFKIIRNHGTK